MYCIELKYAQSLLSQLPARTTTHSCRLNDKDLFNIYFQGRQWICFLRMQDGLISKSAWINTRNIRRGRFAFVDIGKGRRWGNPLCTTKPTTCSQRRLGSAWASAQSDQSLRCPHEESLGPWLPFERIAKTDLRLKMMCIMYLSFVTPTHWGRGHSWG